MENAGIFYGQLEYFTVIWYILWPFGNVVVMRYIFPRFGILCQDKSGNPAALQDKKGSFQQKKPSFTFPSTLLICLLSFPGFLLPPRVARLFLAQTYQNRENI
jgi:hypothetical protein